MCRNKISHMIESQLRSFDIRFLQILEIFNSLLPCTFTHRINCVDIQIHPHISQCNYRLNSTH